MRFARVQSLAQCNRMASLSRVGGYSGYRWLHKREECKLRRACCVSGKVASLQGRPGQCAAASVASFMRLARVQSLAQCNRMASLSRDGRRVRWVSMVAQAGGMQAQASSVRIRRGGTGPGLAWTVCSRLSIASVASCMRFAGLALSRWRHATAWHPCQR